MKARASNQIGKTPAIESWASFRGNHSPSVSRLDVSRVMEKPFIKMLLEDPTEEEAILSARHMHDHAIRQ
jgi:hypothetical protein